MLVFAQEVQRLTSRSKRPPQAGRRSASTLPLNQDINGQAMPKATEAHVYQIKVTLEGIKPPIWRRLLVSSTISLKDFHEILQTAIGWTDSHLHQFEARGEVYGVPDLDLGVTTKNEARVRLADVLIREKDAMRYEYDFGDGWTHKIVLERAFPHSGDVVVPSCVAGKRACPPEDCGGIWGYEEFLRAVRDPAHPEHEEMLEWIGGSFDPEHFDAVEISRWLAPRKRGPRA